LTLLRYIFTQRNTNQQITNTDFNELIHIQHTKKIIAITM